MTADRFLGRPARTRHATPDCPRGIRGACAHLSDLLHSLDPTHTPEGPDETENRMSLVDKLDATPKRMPGMPCSVGSLLDRLPAEEAEALNKMLHELGWSASAIYDAVTAEGYEVGRQTIGRHRSRACVCFRAAA